MMFSLLPAGTTGPGRQLDEIAPRFYRRFAYMQNINAKEG